MLDRATVRGWTAWAIAAALPLAGAAFLLLGLRRSYRKELDSYEEWWRQRERIRANGSQPSPHTPRRPDVTTNDGLFV